MGECMIHLGCRNVFCSKPKSEIQDTKKSQHSKYTINRQITQCIDNTTQLLLQRKVWKRLAVTVQEASHYACYAQNWYAACLFTSPLLVGTNHVAWTWFCPHDLSLKIWSCWNAFSGFLPDSKLNNRFWKRHSHT